MEKNNLEDIRDLLGCYFNQDFDFMYKNINEAIDKIILDFPKNELISVINQVNILFKITENEKNLEKFLDEYPKVLKEFENLLQRNRIFMERTIGGGAISPDRAMQYGMTGPNLRASGVDYDVRVHAPYSSYEDFDFKVPTGSTGDNYDRWLVRNAEMWESLKIIDQAYKKIQEFKGTEAEVYHADVPAYYLPEKKDVYTKMEALIYHFKIIMGEVEMPKGEVYNAVEGANGELGFYFISDGGRAPYRLHFRRPCFIYYQAYEEIVKGSMLSDAVVTLSSLNLIAGEMDG